jgi:hypothetical protein
MIEYVYNIQKNCLFVNKIAHFGIISKPMLIGEQPNEVIGHLL